MAMMMKIMPTKEGMKPWGEISGKCGLFKFNQVERIDGWIWQ